MLEEASSSENYQPLYPRLRPSQEQQQTSNPPSPTTSSVGSPNIGQDRGARRPTFFGDIAKSALSTPTTTQAGRLNILGALLSHDTGVDSDNNSDSSTRSSSPIPVRLRKDTNSRRRRKTDAPLPIPISSSPPNDAFGSIPNFAESAEETKRLVAALQRTEDISITLDDSANTVNVNNTIYVKMDYAKTQVEDIMSKFSNAKQEFKEKTKKLQKHFEKQDNEKMAKIQSFMEEFNEKYTSMQKRYQETLSKKYKEKIDDLGGKVRTYASEKDHLHERLVSETTKYYEDMRVFISSFEKIIAGIREKERERADQIISDEKATCRKEIDSAYSQLTKSIAVQKKLFFGLVSYLKTKEKECCQLGKDLTESRSTAKTLKENNEKLTINLKESEIREKDYVVIVNNQKDKIIDLGKRLDFFITKTFSDANVNTELTGKVMDNTNKEFEHQTKVLTNQIQELTKEMDNVKTQNKTQAQSIKTYEENFENLQMKIEKLSTIISKLQQENETMSNSLKLEKESQSSLQETRKQLEVRVTELTRKDVLTKDILKNQKQKITNLEGQLSSSMPPQDASVFMDGLRKEIQTERDEKQLLQGLIIEKEALISSIENKFNDSVTKYKDLELNFLKMEEQFSSQLSNLKESKIGVPTIIEKVIPVASKSTSTNNSQTDARYIEIEELEEVTIMVETIRSELQNSKQQVKELEKQIKHITESYAVSEAMLISESKDREAKLQSEFNERESLIQSESKVKERKMRLEFDKRESNLLQEYQERESKQTENFNKAQTIFDMEISVREKEKLQLQEELTSMNGSLNEKSTLISILKEQVTSLQTELDAYQKVATETIDFNRKEVVIRHFNSLRRELEILKAELDLRKSVEEELREEIERLKKDIGLTTGKYRNLLNQSHFRHLEDSTETVHLEEEMDRLTVENKQLSETNKLLQFQIANFSNELNLQESQKFQQLYLAEREKTTKLSSQCKQFVLKITELEQYIETLSSKCEKGYDDISRERQRTDVALRLVKKGQKEKEDFLTEIENLKHQLEVALEVLRRNQFEQEFYRMLKKSTLIKGIL